MRGVARGLAALGLFACTHDFASFHVGDGGAPIDAPFDAPSDAPHDAPPDTASDVSNDGCMPDQGCLSTATQCTASCNQTETTCINNCGNPSCRNNCMTTDATCKNNCQIDCNLCEQSAGCPDQSGCASATL